MPTETFLRLPEEKRLRFIDAAWEEFVRVPFEEASINKIILRARIPRGSFYQYFADKRELFYYLLKDMMHDLLDQYSEILCQNNGDIFKTQMQCFDQGLSVGLRDPQLNRGVEVLSCNPVFLVQQIIENQVGYGIWETVKKHVDLSPFRSEDENLAKEAFVVSLVVLVISMADAMSHPETISKSREILRTQLDILKHGSIYGGPEGGLHE